MRSKGFGTIADYDRYEVGATFNEPSRRRQNSGRYENWKPDYLTWDDLYVSGRTESKDDTCPLGIIYANQ